MSEIKQYEKIICEFLRINNQNVPEQKHQLVEKFQAKVIQILDFQDKLYKMLNKQQTILSNIYDIAITLLCIIVHIIEKYKKQRRKAKRQKDASPRKQQYIASYKKLQEQYQILRRKMYDNEREYQQKSLKLQYELNKATQQIKSIELQKEISQDTLKIKTYQLEQIVRRNQQNKNNLSITKSQLELRVKEFEEQKLKQKSLERKIQQLKFHITTWQNKYEVLQVAKDKKIKMILQENDSLSKQFEAFKGNSKTKIFQLQNEIIKNQQAYKARQKELTNSFTSRLKQTTNIHEAILKQLKQKQTAQSEYLKQTHEIQKQNSLQKYTKQKEDIVHDYERKLQNLNYNNSSITTQLNKLDESYRKEKYVFLSEISSLEKSNREQESTINFLRRQLEMYVTKSKQLQQANKILDAKLNQYIELYKTTSQSSSEKIQQLQKKNEQIIHLNKIQMTTTLRRLQIQHKTTLEQAKIRILQLKQNEINVIKNNYVQLQKRSERIQIQLRQDLKDQQRKFEKIQKQLNKKLKQTEEKYKIQLKSLNDRNKYQMDMLIQMKRRQMQEERRKYDMKIAYMQQQYNRQKILANNKFLEQKQQLITQLHNQFEEKIQNIHKQHRTQYNQKVNELQRKIKFFEKKINDQQNQNRTLIKEIQRIKAEAKQKMESLSELNELTEEQVAKLNQKIEILQRTKNQEIRSLQNRIKQHQAEIQEVRNQAKKREQFFIESCKRKMAQNFKQMKSFVQNVQKQTVKLEEKHRYRYSLLQKEYEQIKHMYQTRKSKPEDIEALKVLHRAYQQKQSQLTKQKQFSSELKRQLTNKEISVKLFSSNVMKISGTDFPFPKKK